MSHIENQHEDKSLEVTETTNTENNREHPAEDKQKELEERINELKDQLLRKAAEFENYRKRSEAERLEFLSYANEKLMMELLPVMDDFQRAFESYDKNKDEKAFYKGAKLIYGKLINILTKQGLKEIKSTGEKFDVELHEALMQKPCENTEPGTILETIEKGYYFKDKVLRHAKVIVSSKPEKSE